MVIKYTALNPPVRYVSLPWVLFVILFLTGACLVKLTLFWSITNYSNTHDRVITEITPTESYREFSPKILKNPKAYTTPVYHTTASVTKSSSGYKVVCYYTLPAISGDLDPKVLDPYLCTHIIIGFAEIENCTISPNKINETEVYKTIVGLKHANPSLKVLISVGGPPSDGGFREVISSEGLRTGFVDGALKFIGLHGLDGIDFDWEFPSWPKTVPDERRNFTLLLKKFREEINKNRSKSVISVAVAAPGPIITQSYEVAEMAKYIDFVNLMSYDYHMYTSVLPLTGPNAPLYRRPAESGYLQTLNTNWSVSQWLYLGMPRDKLIVGIPTFGHSFTLLNENNVGWDAPATGYGRVGSQGFVTYEQACQFTSHRYTTHVFDDDYKVPYAYYRREWISYENDESVMHKANYIKDNRLGGGMIFSLNVDDYKGKCGSQQFSLTRKISNILTGNS